MIEDPGYEFADPCPPSMRQVSNTLLQRCANTFLKHFQVKISDLSCVDINWRMLTLARPENKIDEEIFSK